MLGRGFAVASSAFCRGAMKEELLQSESRVGGSEEAVAEVSLESASYFTEGLLAMHRREVLEVRVGGPRIIRPTVAFSPVSSSNPVERKVELLFEHVGQTTLDMELSVEHVGQTTLDSNSSTSAVTAGTWSSCTIYFVGGQRLCMRRRSQWSAKWSSWSSVSVSRHSIATVLLARSLQACKVFVLPRWKKPPDRHVSRYENGGAIYRRYPSLTSLFLASYRTKMELLSRRRRMGKAAK
jgi:hypothetical protein